MIKNNLNLYVIKDPARYYNSHGEDRLSTKANVINRADKILRDIKDIKEVFHIVGILLELI